MLFFVHCMYLYMCIYVYIFLYICVYVYMCIFWTLFLTHLLWGSLDLCRFSYLLLLWGLLVLACHEVILFWAYCAPQNWYGGERLVVMLSCAVTPLVWRCLGLPCLVACDLLITPHGFASSLFHFTGPLGSVSFTYSCLIPYISGTFLCEYFTWFSVVFVNILNLLVFTFRKVCVYIYSCNMSVCYPFVTLHRWCLCYAYVLCHRFIFLCPGLTFHCYYGWLHNRFPFLSSWLQWD